MRQNIIARKFSNLDRFAIRINISLAKCRFFKTNCDDFTPSSNSTNVERVFLCGSLDLEVKIYERCHQFKQNRRKKIAMHLHASRKAVLTPATQYPMDEQERKHQTPEDP
jgi:hypothetical protein